MTAKKTSPAKQQVSQFKVVTKLGKIQSVRFGRLDPKNAIFGLRIEIGGDGWQQTIEDQFPSHLYVEAEKAKISASDRTKQVLNCIKTLELLMIEARIVDVLQLINIPVAVDFDDAGKLISWRILKEVL